MTTQLHGTASRSRLTFVSYATMFEVLGLSLLLATFFVVGASAQTNWTLVWSDGEIETNCAPGSNTAPCSASNTNIFQDGNGNLVIQAINTNGNWTSGRMKTEGLVQFQYGRIEARIKLPVGAGLWPAFWMLGTGSADWPQGGEQDIMEWVNLMGPMLPPRPFTGPDTPEPTASAYRSMTAMAPARRRGPSYNSRRVRTHGCGHEYAIRVRQIGDGIREVVERGSFFVYVG